MKNTYEKLVKFYQTKFGYGWKKYLKQDLEKVGNNPEKLLKLIQKEDISHDWILFT